MAATKHSVADYGKNAITQQKQAPLTQTKLKHQIPSMTRAEKCTKLKSVGTEPMRQLMPGKESENLPSQPIK